MRSRVVESQGPSNTPSGGQAVSRKSGEGGKVSLWSPDGDGDDVGSAYSQFSEGPLLEDPALQPATRNVPSRLIASLTEGWFALVLLVIAVCAVVFCIISANWVSHTSLLFLSVAVGLVLGMVVAKIQRMPQAVLHLAACLVGHWFSVWLTSVVAFHVSWMFLLGDLRAAITGGQFVTSGGALIFFFYLSFLCFYLGYFGTWLIYRARLPWLVALVYCAIFLINLRYVKQDLSLLIIILLTALTLLIVRVQLVTQLAQWTRAGLYTDRSWLRRISRHFMQWSSILALLVLLISWLLPTAGQPVGGVVFWDHLNNAWTNIIHGKVSLQNPGSAVQPSQSAITFFGDHLTITGSVSLPNGEVLHYSSTAAPQYLEGFTFDHFDGHTWVSSFPGKQQSFNAQTLLPTDTVRANYKRATTDVTIVQPPEGSMHYIFAPAQPVAFNVPTTVYTNGTTSTWTQQSPLVPSEHYQATSNVTRATAEDLSKIPLPRQGVAPWARDKYYGTIAPLYRQLPHGLSSTILATTQQWTRGATNTYAVAKLLEAHLSDPSEFTYSLSNPAIPNNVDAVSWLLQTHQGYCTYYATAMTVMARQMGIPARVVNGFSQGTFDAQRKVWVVNGNDAHSWVQVYFPGYGWINFDPTPGYSLHTANSTHPQPIPSPVSTVQPTKPVPTSSAPDQQPIHQASGNPQTGTLPATIAHQSFVEFSILILLCSFFFLLIAFFSYWWRNLYAGANLVSRTFWRVCRLGGWAGLPPQVWQTPYEYSSMLSQQCPQATAPLRRLTELFVRDRWAAANETPYGMEEEDVERLWPHLRDLLVLRLMLLRGRATQSPRLPHSPSVNKGERLASHEEQGC